MKQKELIFNFFVNRNWKKFADSRKRAEILADNRKSHHPIETLLVCYGSKPGRHFARNLHEFGGARWEEVEVNQWIVLCFQIYNLDFYRFLKFTVGKPEVITNWLFSKQRTHELTIVFLWLSLLI